MMHYKSILSYFLLIGCCMLGWGCQSPSGTKSVPQAEKGLLDLSNWDFEEDGIVPLDGNWQFYWRKLLNPQDLLHSSEDTIRHFLAVPGVWNQHQINDLLLPGQGYATYRLKVKLNKKYKNLALKVNTFSTAAAIYVNGERISTSGYVSDIITMMRPSYRPHLARIPGEVLELDIIIQVSNFYYTKGGIWDSLYIGQEAKVKKARKQAIILAIFLAGSIFMMGMYNLALYFTYTKDRASLYFAWVCVLVSLRVLCTDEYLITSLTRLDWIWVLRLEYLSYYLSILFFGAFMDCLFHSSYPRFVFWFILGYCLVFAATVFILPSVEYTKYVIYHQGITLFFALFFSYVLVVAIWRKNKIAIVLFIGWTLLVSTLINDVLHTNHIVNTGNYTPYGIFGFLFSYAYILTKRLSDTFDGVEDLNQILQNQNKNLEQTVLSRTQDLSKVNEKLTKSNQVIQRQNRKMQSSIRYARRIQQASLPEIEKIQEYIPESFVYFKPREVVSGDFYWFGYKNGKILLAVVDCAGHGVPGAFMSMIVNDLLGEVIMYQGITDVSKVLNKIHEKTQERLYQNSAGKSPNYGIDIALIAIDPVKKQLEFAGANRPLFYIRNNKIRDLAGDWAFIGRRKKGRNPEDMSFQKHVLPIHLPTTIYLFSDGFTNQLGGSNNKKYLSKRLKKLLQLLHQLPMSEQENLLDEALQLWQNPFQEEEPAYVQTDDILIVGLKLNFQDKRK